MRYSCSHTINSYVFTYNNPEETWSPQAVWDADKPPKRLRFLAGQFEIAPGTGTRHFQGYVVFNNPQGLPGCRRLLKANGAHFEPRQGTHEQALTYVSKEETREPGCHHEAFGDPPEQGARHDLDDLFDTIQSGASERDIVLKHFGSYVKYSTGIRRAVAALAPRRTEYSPPKCYYIWGAAGTGKTRAVYESYDWESIFSVSLATPGAVWFDGYDPRRHKVVIFDDYYHHFRFYYLLQLLDGYPVSAPVKGSFINFCPDRVYITSNISLGEQYPNIPDAKSLWRRFRRVVYVENDRWIFCSLHNPVPTLNQ